MASDIPHVMDGKLVSFLASDGLILNGFLTGKRGSGKCIVYVHGMTGNFYYGRMPLALAENVRARGFSTFVINTRGHDMLGSGRFAKGARRRVPIGTMVEKFEDSIKDLDGALRFLRGMGYREFFLVGHSTGCQKILYYQHVRMRSDVKALVFLAPDDDYNLNRRNLGKRWKGMVERARALSRTKSGNVYNPKFPFSPARFLSVADPRRIEARLFNYDGSLAEFSGIRTPMYVVFGTRDEGAVKPVRDYISILWENTSSDNFGSLIIKNARHSFSGYEDTVARAVTAWLSKA